MRCRTSSADFVWVSRVFVVTPTIPGSFPRRRPFAVAVVIPSPVRVRIRSDSSSATIPSTFTSSRSGRSGQVRWIAP